MDIENKVKFDEVIAEIEEHFKEHKIEEFVECSNLSIVLAGLVTKRPMLCAGEVSDLMTAVRSKVSDDTVNRLEIVINLLGSTEEEQETRFKELPYYIRWAFKGFVWCCAALEYVAFGVESLYKKVRKWIVGLNTTTSIDSFAIPEEMPSLQDAMSIIADKAVLEEKLIEYITGY